MFGRGTLAAVAAMLALAAPAQAMHVYVNHDSLVAVAAAGEANALRIQPDPVLGGAAFAVTDPGVTFTTGPGCSGLPLGGVRCALAPEYPVASLSLSLGDRLDVATVTGDFFSFQVNSGEGDDTLDLIGAQVPSAFSGPSTYVRLGGGHDRLRLTESFGGHTEVYGDAGDDDITAHGRVSGGPGADTLRGGLQADALFGDAGDDVIHSADSAGDAVNCGPGADQAVADPLDGLTACEAVTRCPYFGDTSQLPRVNCTLDEVRGFLP